MKNKLSNIMEQHLCDLILTSARMLRWDELPKTKYKERVMFIYKRSTRQILKLKGRSKYNPKIVNIVTKAFIEAEQKYEK